MDMNSISTSKVSTRTRVLKCVSILRHGDQRGVAVGFERSRCVPQCKSVFGHGGQHDVAVGPERSRCVPQCKSVLRHGGQHDATVGLERRVVSVTRDTFHPWLLGRPRSRKPQRSEVIAAIHFISASLALRVGPF